MSDPSTSKLLRKLAVATEALEKLSDPVGHATPRQRDRWIRETARAALEECRVVGLSLTE